MDDNDSRKQPQSIAATRMHRNLQTHCPAASAGNDRSITQAQELTATSSGAGRQLPAGPQSCSTSAGGMKPPPPVPTAARPIDPCLAQRALRAALTPAKRTQASPGTTPDPPQGRHPKKSRKSSHGTPALKPALAPQKHLAPPEAPTKMCTPEEGPRQIRPSLLAGLQKGSSGPLPPPASAESGDNWTGHFDRWQMGDDDVGYGINAGPRSNNQGQQPQPAESDTDTAATAAYCLEKRLCNTCKRLGHNSANCRYEFRPCRHPKGWDEAYWQERARLSNQMSQVRDVWLSLGGIKLNTSCVLLEVYSLLQYGRVRPVGRWSLLR